MNTIFWSILTLFLRQFVVCQSGCTTEIGCTCKQSWSYKSINVNDCSNPDGDVYGSWCVVNEQSSEDSFCAPQWKVKETGEFWDRCYCAPKINVKGCVTQGGCVCKSSWQYKGVDVNECGNPDGDAVGPWCIVDDQQGENCNPLSTVNGTGEFWDRCYCNFENYQVEESAVIQDSGRSIALTDTPIVPTPVALEGCEAPDAIWCDVEFLKSFKMNMPLVAQYELVSWVDGTKALAATNPCNPTQPWFGVTCSYIDQQHLRVTKIALGMYDWTYQNQKWTPNWAAYRAIPSSQLPRDLSKVAYLEELELAYTFIDAPLPPEISSLKNLKVLDFSGNSVQENAGVYGTLPPEFSVLTNLQVFYAFQNKITGTIPVEYSTLVNLDQFRISSNKLIGSIPEQLSTIQGELWFGGNAGNTKETNTLCVWNEFVAQNIDASALQTDITSILPC